MAARKPIIDPKEAVQFIRMGVSDDGLMRKYDLSSRGLESLFRKLIQAGALDRSEIAQRTGLLERNGSVVLAGFPEQDITKIPVNAHDAVQAIRSGLSDLELMRRFALSAKGVDKLFKKLILAGQLTQEELDRRAYTSQMYQVAELDELPEPVVPKPRVKAAHAVKDIRADMNDAALMEKYGLSAKGLESLFRKLVLAGEIMQAELDQRLLTTQSSHYVDLEEALQSSDAKCRIKAPEAIRDIRSGMSDAALMRKYEVSVKGLESLFRKLVIAGKIAQAELDRRGIVSQQSHFVDLAERPEPTVPKVRVKASELASCIRAGMDDAALMERFSLSARGLEGLLRKLVAAAKMRQEELDARKGKNAYAEPSLSKDAKGQVVRNSRIAEEDDGEFELSSSNDQGGLSFLWHYHRGTILAVIAVILFTVVTVVVYVHGVPGNRFQLLTRSRMNPSMGSDEDLQKKVTELSTILEHVNRDPYRKEGLQGIPGVDDLQECLKTCTRDHSSRDDSERGLLMNCRMECMAKHGKAIKAIRKRYYGDLFSD